MIHYTPATLPIGWTISVKPLASVLPLKLFQLPTSSPFYFDGRAFAVQASYS
jgi:hypothetical protein